MDERRRWRVKKKYMLMGIAAVLILATMVGGTLAALNTKSEKAVANISIKSVGSACGTGRRRGKRTGYDRAGGNDHHAEGSTKRYPGWL